MLPLKCINNRPQNNQRNYKKINVKDERDKLLRIYIEATERL